MLRITVSEVGAIYIGLRELAPGVAARTEIVVEPERLMFDFDAGGALVGIEILDPSLLPEVPGILASRGLPVPACRFDKLAEALTAPAA